MHILSHVKCAARDNNDKNRKNSNKILCFFNCSSAAASLSGRRSATESKIQNTIISLNGWFCDSRNFISSQFVRPKFTDAYSYMHSAVKYMFSIDFNYVTYIGQCVRVCLSWLCVCVFAIDANEFYLRLYGRERAAGSDAWSKLTEKWWWMMVAGVSAP